MATRAQEERVVRTGPLFWTPRASLTARILAVNIITLALMAGSVFYLDSYRAQLVEERFKIARSEAEIIADALADAPAWQRRTLLARIGQEQNLRLRLYDSRGTLIADSFAIGGPSFRFADPAAESWLKKGARTLDRAVDFIVRAPSVPRYQEPAEDQAERWPEIIDARDRHRTVTALRYAADRTPVITAAAPLDARGEMLLSLRNAPETTQAVRDARQTLAIIVAVAAMLSIQLSLFLARTIVSPLRSLVRAAVRVRLGRDRQVVVPRLPERGDEIGLLARALSDMTAALRDRIDAGERFAADVAHELKNPLASLRSALETLERVEDPALRRQLAGIAAHDVQRIDRLITDIADASRIDAELSRTTFVPVDLAQMIGGLIGARSLRADGAARPQIALRVADSHAIVVRGDPVRLERVIENLLDNAVSFSPPDSEITVTIARAADQVRTTVCDRGPGIPPADRERVFERFHSLRPEEEAFGDHSGLGLAIARTIVEAHEGRLDIADRPDGERGACLILDLPAAEA